MAQGVRNGAVDVMFCTASSMKNCYPCQWAKLLPMSPAGQGNGLKRFHVSGKCSSRLLKNYFCTKFGCLRWNEIPYN